MPSESIKPATGQAATRIAERLDRIGEPVTAIHYSGPIAQGPRATSKVLPAAYRIGESRLIVWSLHKPSQQRWSSLARDAASLFGLTPERWMMKVVRAGQEGKLAGVAPRVKRLVAGGASVTVDDMPRAAAEWLRQQVPPPATTAPTVERPARWFNSAAAARSKWALSSGQLLNALKRGWVKARRLTPKGDWLYDLESVRSHWPDKPIPRE